MSTKELKGSMVDLLASINDPDLLQDIYNVVNQMIAYNVDKTDFWDDLTPEQQAELEQSLAESENPENLVEHEMVKNEFAKWLNK
jgi:hypothetical protein